MTNATFTKFTEVSEHEFTVYLEGKEKDLKAEFEALKKFARSTGAVITMRPAQVSTRELASGYARIALKVSDSVAVETR